MKARCCLLLSLILALAPCFCLGASQEDLLDQLDSVMSSTDEETPPEKREGFGFYQLADHLEMLLTLKYGHMFENRGRDDDTGEAKIDFSSWAGTDMASFHFSGWLEAGSQKRTYAGVSDAFRDEDRRRNHLEINELYGFFSFGNLEVSLGKKVFALDSSQLYSPGRIYHSEDFNVPVDSKTLGIWHGAIDYSLSDIRLSFAVLPVFQEHKIPENESRWMPWQLNSSQWFEDEFQDSIKRGYSISDLYRLLYYFRDALRGDDILRNLLDNRTIVFEKNLPGANFRDMGYSARIKGSAGMWDLYGSYYSGPGSYPLIRIDNRPKEVAVIWEYPPVHRIAGGFSTAWKGIEFHGEGAYTYSENRRDDSYVSFFGGITYINDSLALKINCDRMEISLNFGKEHIISHQNADGYYFSSETIRLFKGDIVPGITLFVNEALTLYYLTDQDLKYDSQYHRAGLKYRLMPGLVSDIYLESFDGDDRSFIGRWRDNDRVCFVLKWNL